jgi:hypothetical protein
MSYTIIAVPHYDSISAKALPGLGCPSTTRDIEMALAGGSFLTFVFNQLWCTALNQRKAKGITHFAMHHADIAAPTGWLDLLHEEMEKSNADVISSVIAIKDSRGLTSTGFRSPNGDLKRLTMTEVEDLPHTFDIATLIVQGLATGQDYMLINTGLWLCDFTKPWVEEMCFDVRNSIVKHEDGIFRAHALSEDWDFSRFCHEKGLSVYATTRIPIQHYGNFGFANTEPWGTWKTDQGDTVKPDAA